MKLDHDEAEKWAEEMLRLDSVSPLGKTGNAAACYLDAMTRLDKAEKERDAAKALLREIEVPLARCDGELSAIHHRGTVDRDNCKNFSAAARALGVKIRAFLERKTDDKQS